MSFNIVNVLDEFKKDLSFNFIHRMGDISRNNISVDELHIEISEIKINNLTEREVFNLIQEKIQKMILPFYPIITGSRFESSTEKNVCYYSAYFTN